MKVSSLSVYDHGSWVSAFSLGTPLVIFELFVNNLELSLVLMAIGFLYPIFATFVSLPLNLKLLLIIKVKNFQTLADI